MSVSLSDLAAAWAPVERWFDSASPRCPCKAHVAPLLANWRAFRDAPDPSGAAEQLEALQDAIATIQRYAARSGAEDDPQWDPLREGIAAMREGSACAAGDPNCRSLDDDPPLGATPAPQGDGDADNGGGNPLSILGNLFGGAAQSAGDTAGKAAGQAAASAIPAVAEAVKKELPGIIDAAKVAAQPAIQEAGKTAGEAAGKAAAEAAQKQAATSTAPILLIGGAVVVGGGLLWLVFGGGKK